LFDFFHQRNSLTLFYYFLFTYSNASSSCDFVISTSRGFDPFAAEIIPLCSNESIRRAARLYPILNFLCNNEVFVSPFFIYNAIIYSYYFFLFLFFISII